MPQPSGTSAADSSSILRRPCRRRVFRDRRGLLGGEVMECVHARLPGGCGQTVHCDACTIRKAIRHTLDAGAPLHRQRAYVERHDGRLDVWISTYPVGKVVKLVIDSRAR